MVVIKWDKSNRASPIIRSGETVSLDYGVFPCLQRLNISTTMFPSMPIQGVAVPPSLVELDMSFSSLRRLPRQFFACSRLGRCASSSGDESAHRDRDGDQKIWCPSPMRVLRMVQCGLTSVDCLGLETLYHVEEVDLSRNSIETLGHGPYKTLERPAIHFAGRESVRCLPNIDSIKLQNARIH